MPEFLRTNFLFSGIADEEKEELLKSGKSRKCTRGQMLFAQVDAVSHFYVVKTGTIQLFRTTPDGHEKTIELLKSGQTFCENEIMDSCTRHRVNAVAVEEGTTVIEFPTGWLKEASRKNSTFALNLLSIISQQVHLAEIEAEHQATMTAAQLVACFMQRLCVLYGFDPKSFELPYSKSLIASRLGMELETFSRTLGKLKDQGLVVEGTHVSIQDLKRIEHYVCGFCSISEDCTTHQAMEARLGLS